MQSKKFLQGVLINQVRLLAGELGRPPTAKEFDNDLRTESTSKAVRCFGTWNGFLESAGLPVNNIGGRRYTKEELIAQVQTLANELGGTPTYKEFTMNPRTASSPTIVEYFGSWNTFLAEAGLPVGYRRGYSKEELITQVQALAYELGRPPLKKEFEKDPRSVSAVTACNRFGTWNAFLESAGLESIGKSRCYLKDDLISRVKEIAKDLGKTPTMVEFAKDPRGVSITAIIGHFGSWNDFLKEAGLTINRRGNNK